MLVWFASGLVMLFVRWPEVTPAERAAALAPMDWRHCCVLGDLQGPQTVAAARIEMAVGRPVLRLDDEVLDLSTGRRFAGVSPAGAAQAATAFAATRGVHAQPLRITLIQRDQWTVMGGFDPARPFWRVDLDDPGGTQVYVSSRQGEVAQFTQRTSRVLSWLGPIPHWLYFEALRRNVGLWSQVVIWAAVIGIFLTVSGLYLGVLAWRRGARRRATPFHGLMAWHHLTGLVAGVLTLTWVASGLVSMNPWGFLEGSAEARMARVTGTISRDDLRRAILAARDRAVPIRTLRAAPLDGRLFLVSERGRQDSSGRPAPLVEAELSRLAARLGPLAISGMIRAEDAYYYGHHTPVRLPVYRVILTNGARYYLDPESGEAVKYVDVQAQGYRWLHQGLHRLDLIPGLDRGPAWAAAMTALLLLAGVSVATGVVLAWRRLRA